MDQIKKYIVSSHTFDNSIHYDKNFSNNNSNDTLTLTKVVENENKITNNNDLNVIKKELIELKHAISDNNQILKEILLKTN